MAVRMAMVGGGPGAFIGDVHRMAARLDGAVELVAGAFSADPQASRQFGASLGLAPGRAYGTWHEMISGEARQPAADRAEFVAIVTPNDLHLPVALAALEAGFHVLSDKPATRTLDEARVLERAVAQSGRRYALTHAYLGYPAVLEAHERVRRGDLGDIRRIELRYTQGWLADSAGAAGSKQAAWRTDPARSGPGGAIADIGVHAFTLAEYVTGLTVERLLADLGRVVAGREVDDDAMAFLRYAGGARGLLAVSQIATGEGNELTLAVYGTHGGLVWRHGRSDNLTLLDPKGAREILTVARGAAGTAALAQGASRLPAGHPEGFLGAFANLYSWFAADVRDLAGPMRSPAGISTALRGMAFVDAMLVSDAAGQRWTRVAADSGSPRP